MVLSSHQPYCMRMYHALADWLLIPHRTTMATLRSEGTYPLVKLTTPKKCVNNTSLNTPLRASCASSVGVTALPWGESICGANVSTRAIWQWPTDSYQEVVRSG